MKSATLAREMKVLYSDHCSINIKDNEHTRIVTTSNDRKIPHKSFEADDNLVF